MAQDPAPEAVSSGDPRRLSVGRRRPRQDLAHGSVYASLPLRARRRAHFHHFMRDVHAQLRQLGAYRDPLELVARNMARKARVLCLDELFVSDIADAMLLAGLFEALLRYGVLLVMTSNLPPSELYRDGLQRSRFCRPLHCWSANWKSSPWMAAWTIDCGTCKSADLSGQPRAGTRTHSCSDLFEQLALRTGRDGSPQLTICGRTLRARRRCGDVVWFDFSSLCEGPRSQEDYVEIAREFHTVLLSDVPVFASAQQDNAARRFIALLDEFYDQGVKLLLSAAAAPHALYRAERLQFEFRRTASRLIEMQTQEYLARPHRE